MVNEISIINSDTLESVLISKYQKPVILDIIDWDSPEISNESYRVPYQIGETFLGSTVGTRNPTITGYIVSEPVDIKSLKSWEEYYNAQEQSIEKTKKLLNKVISIYQDIVISCDGYYLKGRPTQPIVYSYKAEENNEVMCMFSIELKCYNPMFYKDSKFVSLASAEGMFRFPLIMTEETGDEYVVFGEILKKQAVNITNDGDVPSGCVITIKASGGSVTNPSIYNVNKNEGITFYGLRLEDGDTLTINTNIGEESAVHHSLSRSADSSVVANIQKGSKFIQINPGSSLYSYTVQEGEENNVEMGVTYMEWFFNMEKM